MTWSANKVRRRLQIPCRESLVVWARADGVGMRVPFPVTGAQHRWPSYVALTEGALWVCRSGVTARFGLEQVVMASLVDDPDGALRVDFLIGEPLVVLLSDGGSFVHALAGEILAYDRQLQRWAPTATGTSGPAGRPSGAEQPPYPFLRGVPSDGHYLVRSGPRVEQDDARALLYEAQLIVRRELRLVLTEAGTRSTGCDPD